MGRIEKTNKEVELDELQNRNLYMQELELLETKPAAAYDPSDGMSEGPLSNFVRFLFELQNSKEARLTSVQETLADVKSELKASNQIIKSQERNIEKLTFSISIVR